MFEKASFGVLIILISSILIKAIIINYNSGQIDIIILNLALFLSIIFIIIGIKLILSIFDKKRKTKSKTKRTGGKINGK
ncbi:MAG TPA: hypothetical protein ENI61_04085 [Ignavibacteria bacterium]|nr:hypothetical protein [Ignavibacteria bacterium]